MPYNVGMEQSNIIEYVKDNVLNKLENDAKRVIFLTLAKGFEHIGDVALELSHTEFARRFKKDVRDIERVRRKDELAKEDIDLGLDFTFGDEKQKEEKVKKITQLFSDEEYTILVDKNNWFMFLRHSMIAFFINDQMALIHQIQLRKKTREMLKDGGKSADIAMIKLMQSSQGTEEDRNVIHYSSSIMPRWDLAKDPNKDQWVEFFGKAVLAHLTIDGFSMPVEEKND